VARALLRLRQQLAPQLLLAVWAVAAFCYWCNRQQPMAASCTTSSACKAPPRGQCCVVSTLGVAWGCGVLGTARCCKARAAALHRSTAPVGQQRRTPYHVALL